MFADQIQRLLQGNNKAIASTTAAAVQVVVPVHQGALAGAGGPRTNYGNPFAKMLKTFVNIDVVKFSVHVVSWRRSIGLFIHKGW